MRPLHYFNGWIFIALKKGSSRHSQYNVTVVARTKKRALELLQEYGANINAHHMTNYFSRVDKLPSSEYQPVPADECIMVQPDNPGPYVLLTPELRKK
jgi:hypothetical protein